MRINKELAKKWKIQKILFSISIVLCVLFFISAIFVGLSEQDAIIPTMTIIISIISLIFLISSIILGVSIRRTKKEIMLKDYA